MRIIIESDDGGWSKTGLDAPTDYEADKLIAEMIADDIAEYGYASSYRKLYECGPDCFSPHDTPDEKCYEGR